MLPFLYMKNIVLTLATLLITVASCATPLSTRMDTYIDKVEERCDKWTDEDWELSQQEYDILLKEYKENYSTYTQEERDAINRAIGRYNGLLVKKGITKAGTLLEDFVNRIPSLIDGFVSAFEKE